MATKKFWYSVRNGGDGSAYPTFFESEELAELDQEYLDEGWGESCTGYLEVEVDCIVNANSIRAEVYTAEDVRDELLTELKYLPEDELLLKHLAAVELYMKSK